MKEIWKDIKGYEGLYQISNFGRVKSVARFRKGKNGVPTYCRERIIKSRTNPKTGYVEICLSKEDNKKLFLVHRLVAETFIPNPGNLPQVNHINEVKSDNRVENLEWVTNAENIEHAIKTGLQDNTSAKMNKLGGQIRTAFERGYVIKDIAEKNGISEKTIRRRVYDFKPEPITTLKVGRIRAYFYYDKSRKKYRVESNDRIPEGKQFNTKAEAQAYVNQFYKAGGFASDEVGKDGLTGRQRASLVGAIGGFRSRRRPSKKEGENE